MKDAAASDLRRTQQLFWELISAPEGVRPAVADLERRGLADERVLEDLFTGNAELPAVERLDIYANMYFYRLLDCLAEDFPKVLAALGPGHFHNLITDYLLRHPSDRPSLRHLGRHLPEFLAGHPLGAELPWAADLARLDWTRADLFDAPDATPLSRDALAALPQDRAGDARLTFVPAFALLRFDHDVVRYWRRLEEIESESGHEAKHAGATGNAAREGPDGSEDGDRRAGEGPRPDPPSRKRTAARVWRKDFVVYHRSVDEDEVRCLELARAGESIGRLFQTLAAGRSVARATERAGRMIQAWLDDGILADVTLP